MASPNLLRNFKKKYLEIRKTLHTFANENKKQMFNLKKYNKNYE